jgi:general L-amino acid transport system permease protein
MIGGPLFGLTFILAMTRTITPTLLTLVGIGIMVAGNRVGRVLPLGIRRRSAWILLALTLLSFGLITGFTPANIDEFGGLLLTIVVAFAGIGLSFPIGVLMALARRSSFPLIRPLSVAYIELVRGVPLISLLFMGQFAIGFLFPPDATIPGPIPRAIIMITLFSGAYVAEVVRGGLQSVPAGQIEAGKALGLSPITITRQIVLPQALRNSIPALIGQFISLLKDVSLLVIIGLQEMLGIVDVVLARPEFTNQGYTPEAYAFVGAVYWTLCFSMSRAAQRLETRLGVGTR